MLYELGRFFLLSIHHKITKTLQGALFLSTGAENHRSTPRASQLALRASQLALRASQLALGPSQLALGPIQLALRPSQLAPRFNQLNPRPSQRCIFLEDLLKGPPNWIQGPPSWL